MSGNGDSALLNCQRFFGSRNRVNLKPDKSRQHQQAGHVRRVHEILSSADSRKKMDFAVVAYFLQQAETAYVAIHGDSQSRFQFVLFTKFFADAGESVFQLVNHPPDIVPVHFDDLFACG